MWASSSLKTDGASEVLRYFLTNVLPTSGRRLVLKIQNRRVYFSSESSFSSVEDPGLHFGTRISLHSFDFAAMETPQYNTLLQQKSMQMNTILAEHMNNNKAKTNNNNTRTTLFSTIPSSKDL